MQRLLAALTVLATLAAGGNAHAQASDVARDKQRRAFWTEVQATCDATARETPRDAARGIAAEARAEHRLWNGHRIDASGRLTHFGLVESESEADPNGSARVTLGQVGWWNVWRYWSVLADQKLVGLEALGLTAIANAVQRREPSAVEIRRHHGIGELFGRLPMLAAGPLREAFQESAIRAMLSDVPWSAAFVSYIVHRGADTRDREKFAFDGAHRGYIDQAIASTRAEHDGADQRAFYRACPIHATAPRPGDLLCYQREETCRGAAPEALRDLVAFADAVPGKPDCRAITKTHCDIVVSVDRPARKVETVGGNVFQSVTLRRMNLSARGRFSPNQGRCDGAAQNCSLNTRDWFLLLQMRGG